MSAIAADPSTTLVAQDISVGYGRADPIIVGVTVRCERAEFVSVIGANGSGKSTLLKGIVGEARVRSGKVLIGTQDLTGLASHRVVHHGVAYVPQSDMGFGSLTVTECLRMSAKASGGDTASYQVRSSRVNGLIPELATVADRRVKALSGGQRAMLSIGMALMHAELRYLVMDEPLAGLSPLFRGQFLDLLGRVASEERVGVLIVEQNVLETIAVSDRTYILQLGRLAFTSAEPAKIAPADLWRYF
jgi:branched-chain amino acid transport system ATP-binding protein